jgi:transcriptional regulator MraZ
MDPNPPTLVEIEPPRGMAPARLDERGRMKLPVPMKEYLDKFRDKRLYVTSLDRTTGRLYPFSIWRETEKFLDDLTDDPDLAERLAFNAADLGEDVELDSQGRIVIPVALRKALGIEDQTVRLRVFRGYIEILSERKYQERLNASSGSAAEDVAKATKLGMGKIGPILVPAPEPAGT